MRGDGVIAGDEAVNGVTSIPAGMAKGPVFLTGTTGYMSQMAVSLGEGKGDWSYLLSVSESYSGPWVRLDSGRIDPTTAYSR